MPNLSAISITAVPKGTLVRIGLDLGANRLRLNKIPTDGVFRVQGGEIHSIPNRSVKRLVNFTRHKFIGYVIDNHAQKGEIRIEVREPKGPLLYYHLVLPYQNIRSMARLVFQALPDLTLEEEDKRRRNNAQSYVDKAYFHPLDKFVAVRLARGPVFQSEQERSFQWTAPSDGSVFTVTIPGTGMIDATYAIPPPGWANIPDGGVWTPVYCPVSARTTTTFELQTNAPILAGTVLDFYLRDV